MKIILFRAAHMLLLGLGSLSLPAWSATALQCVPYARAVSGVSLYGDALTWWDQAQDRYKRGHTPRKGAVLAFRPTGPMTLGHVAVVSRILNDRQVLVRHANWSAPGAIEEDVLAVDVSDTGDWSAVRVWHSPTGQMGARVNPTYGFIYADSPRLNPFTPDDRLGTSLRMASLPAAAQSMSGPSARPQPRLASNINRNTRIAYDPTIISHADASLANRSLNDIIADVKRIATEG